MAGSEFEYYLLTDTYEQAWKKGYVGLERFGYYNEDYHLLQATKGEPIHGELRNLMTEAGIPVEFSKGEAAPGQHEVNIHYTDVLDMADQSVIFKHGAKEIAWLNGFGLTLHGQAGPHLDRVERPPPHVALGQGRARSRSSTTPRPSPTACRRRCATSWAG